MNPMHDNFHDYLSYRLGKYKKRTFFRFNDKKISYQELWEKITQSAAYFQKLNLPRYFKVGLLTKNRPEMVYNYFGTILGGGNIVPINYFLSREEIEFVVDNCEMDILIFSEDYQNIADYLMPRNNKIRQYICLDDHQGSGILNYTQITKDIKPSEYKKIEFKPDDIATILYTSGTTANPKGVELTHQNLICDAVYLADHFFRYQPNKIRYVAFLPLFHSFSFTVGIICMIELGATISLIESILPFKKIINTIMRHRINILVGIPQLFRVLSEKKVPFFLRPIIKLLFPIKSCVSGGAPLPKAVWEKFEKNFKIPMYQGYGLTEASPIVCVNTKEHSKHGSVGTIPEGMLIAKIVDDNGKELPLGEAGELLIKGKTVMAGYFKNPEETEKALKDGWLYTGDIATIDSQGFITIVDRKKDIIISNGMNIYPAEIENTLKKHPAVREAAIFGIPNDHHGEIPVAFIEPYEDKPVSAPELKKFLMKQEAAYKIPKIFEFVNLIPRNATGKIIKRELKKNYLESKAKKKG